MPPSDDHHLPIVPPDEFSSDIERDLLPLLRKRLGHEPNEEELHGYRQLLWAFAIALRALDHEERRKEEGRPRAKKSIKRRKSSS